MPRIYLFLLIGMGLIFTCSCSMFNPLNAELKTESDKFLQSAFSKCGDIYVTERNGSILEIKDPTITFIADDLEEADRLNQTDWKGTGFLNCSSYRMGTSGNWSSCPTATSKKDEFQTLFYLTYTKVNIIKQKGKWKFESVLEIFNPYDCSKLPSEGKSG